MKQSLTTYEKPVTRHDAIKVVKNGKPTLVRIMLMKYDGAIEVYYQEEGYAYEFAYGVADFEGFPKTMSGAMINVYRWGLHYEE